MTETIRKKLVERLAAKGLEGNETDLYIQDVIREAADSSGSTMETIKGRLHLLGWHDDYTDYATIQLIQACFPDG